MDKPQNLKGFRDFLPAQMAIRKKVINILENTFEKYGFQPLQTPTLEYAEVLMGKYGEEADKLLYLFEDRGGRRVGMNYDLTVPTARVMAQYSGQLPIPFKRYQIQPSYRAENTQRGRYRQFTQCDIDTIGTNSPLADAEILAVISDALTALDLNNFVIKYNSRNILFDLIERAGIDRTKSFSVLQSLDKLDKKSEEEVKKELADKDINLSQIDQLFLSIKTIAPDAYLAEVVDLAQKLGVKNLEFSPTLMRGLDYYTGPIFETIVKEPKIGSVTGGGRYDNLIKQLGGPDLPAVGTTLGLDRICDVLEELNLWSNMGSANQILVTNSRFNQSTSLQLTTQLRQAGITTELYLDPVDIGKQLKYADKKGISLVAIINPDNIKIKSKTAEQSFTLSDFAGITAYVQKSTSL